MRSPFTLAVACLAAIMAVEAAPACSKTYTVVAGDTCALAAQKSGTTISKLKSLNTSINSKCSNLRIGQKLCVATGSTTTKKVTSKKAATTKKAAATKKAATTKKAAATKKATTTKKAAATKKATTTKKAATTTSTQTSSASPTHDIANYGLTIQITSKTDFCMMLPSSPGNKAANGGKIDIDAIANSEKNAIAFCTKPSANAPGASTMPVTLLKSAYFYKNTTAEYVQVTGKLNPAAYELSTKDNGGQYDNHGAGSPPNSICYGYRYYVAMVEPNNPDYCVRCCNHYEDCNAGRSEYGCKRVVSNGTY